MAYALMFFVISALILIHELGHLSGAKIAGIPISRFSTGFGPKLWGFKKGGTEYWLSAIPLGGYVLPEISDESEFSDFPVSGRLLFALSGPIANMLAAFFFLMMISVAGSGFSLSAVLFAPFEGVRNIMMQMINSILNLFQHPDQISGIVGIVAIGGQYAGTDLKRILEISVLLNLNLAIFNLVPLPPLDGGKIVMCIFEKIHKPLIRLEMPVAIAGWALMICLMIYATILDVTRLGTGLIS